jgi:hypothetical protein
LRKQAPEGLGLDSVKWQSCYHIPSKAKHLFKILSFFIFFIYLLFTYFIILNLFLVHGSDRRQERDEGAS